MPERSDNESADMFESDQHEFDEEYEELSHPTAPPPLAAKAPGAPLATPSHEPIAGSARNEAPASASPASTVAATPAAVAEPAVDDELEEEEPEFDNEDPQEQEMQDYVDPAEQQELPPPKKKQLNLLIMGGFAALVIFAIFVVYTATRPKDNTPPPGDMGPGIVAVSGLRGHLDTRWDGNAKTGRLVYHLRIEPMEDRWQAGFSQAVLKGPTPMYVNLRLMDATGFALCGKEMDFRFDPRNAAVGAVTVPVLGSNGKKLSAAERIAAAQAARQSEVTQMEAAEVVRERGKDIFQNQLNNDGQVTEVDVQGTLPCSPDQFKQANYWDFNTNFPTLDEQADLLDPKAAARRAKEAELAAHPERRKTSKLPQQGFVMQGDDRVTEYDSVRGLLWARGRTFQIDRRSGAVTANAWVSTNALIHYRCDQEGNCALTASGSEAVLHARLSN